MQNKQELTTEKEGKNGVKAPVLRTAKESAYLAVFVAMLIAAQLAFAAIPGVEIVTVLFVVYAYVFGIRRGMTAATAFSLLRMLLFGFQPHVLVLYLLYYNGLAALFGGMGKWITLGKELRFLWLIILVSCLCTVSFSMLDNVITPLWFGFVWRAVKTYFFASFSVMIPQTICTAVSVGALFLPLRKTFAFIKKGLQ